MDINDIELIDVYERVSFDKSITHDIPTGISRIKIGMNEFLYLIPCGIDYECEGGHYIYSISQQQFDVKFSLSKLER